MGLLNKKTDVSLAKGLTKRFLRECDDSPERASPLLKRALSSRKNPVDRAINLLSKNGVTHSS